MRPDLRFYSARFQAQLRTKPNAKSGFALHMESLETMRTAGNPTNGRGELLQRRTARACNTKRFAVASRPRIARAQPRYARSSAALIPGMQERASFTQRSVIMKHVTTDTLIADLKAVVEDAEELLRATAGQTGEKVAAARARLKTRSTRRGRASERRRRNWLIRRANWRRAPIPTCGKIRGRQSASPPPQDWSSGC